MSSAVKSSLVPFAIPYRGMSTRYPISATPAEFSPWIRDYDNEGGVYEVRQGVKWRFNADTNYISAIGAHPTDKNKVIYIDTSPAATVKWSTYDAVTNVAVDVGSVASSGEAPRALSLSFNQKTFFFLNGNQPLIHDGASLAATTITGPTIANVVAGFVYRSRLYVYEGTSTSVWYSGVPGGIGGAFSTFPFASLTNDCGVIMCGFSFTLSTVGLQSQALLGIVFDTGEVVVYSGAYPASPDWAVFGRARIGSPLSYQSIIEMNGDVLVITDNGIVSMRELFTVAQGDVQAASITTEIEKYWVQLIRAIRQAETPASWTPTSSLTSYINGAFHLQRNKLVIFLPKLLYPNLTPSLKSGYVYESINGALIYDIPTKSWAVHVLDIVASTNQLISNYYWPNFGKLLFGTNAVSGKGGESGWEYWGGDTYRDEYQSGLYQTIQPAIHTAFVETEYQTKVGMVFVTHEGVYSKGQTNVEILADSGSKYTESTTATQYNSTVTRDKYNAGIVGNNFQVKLRTSTPTDGSMSTPYKLISISALIEQEKGVI